ncbi:MAG: YheC/YheD family protein [Firmicutes bacterium]|nr:YheC/YheD family protein [Bacillota bacterium]
MRVRLELTNHGKAGYAVRAPRSLVKGRRRVVVRVGQREVSVHCSSGPAQATLGLSPALMAKMHLRRGMRLHARFDGRVLHIGPLVGILVPATTGLPNPVGNMTLGVRYFIEQARTVGVYAFAFSCSAVDFKRGQIRGYTLSSGGEQSRWVRRLFPLPDVVYDHITYRRRDRAADIRKLRARLTEAGIPFFNQGFFDKWDVHNRLMNSPHMQPHLPETTPLSLEALQEMTAKYRRVFIKPAQGSLGRNIYILTRSPTGRFEFRRGRGRASRQMLNDLSNVEAKLARLKKDHYIVQQGLELCRAYGRAVDIRVIMQRTQHGRWAVTKIFARVARRGRLVSNISAGGKGLSASRTLRRCFSSSKVKSLIREIRRVAHLVCETMAENTDGHLGELGVDVGVDRQGHVWVIEVNSKPHRKAYDTLEGRPTAKRSFRRPMQYAAYLAGFRI